MAILHVSDPTRQPALPTDTLTTPPDTAEPELDRALAELTTHAGEWANLPIRDRRAILAELIDDVSSIAERWATLCQQAEGLQPDRPVAAEEWLVGPFMVLRNLQALDQTLDEIERRGRPQIPGPIRERADGRVTAQVFPRTIWDRVFYAGVTAEVWMEPDVTRTTLGDTMAAAYRDTSREGSVSLVLGAGNVSSIGPMDLLYKLYAENRVVILKMHPANAYLGPVIEDGFRALIDWGVLRVVYGGVEVGQYLCEHEQVDEIHITGSDKTVDAIVFGTGADGRKRKAQNKPRNTTPITSELGNVSPVIVVPGPWSDGDLDVQAERIASMLTNNAGFNCNAARVLVQHRGWRHRDTLRQRLEKTLATVPTRQAWYPGAAERHQRFLDAHPEARVLGSPAAEGELPWAVIPDVDPTTTGDLCFREEAFCGVMSETALDADSPADFLDHAVDFCNDVVWGTLNCSILIHPKSLRDPAVAAAFERALDQLRYGTIAINCWAAVGYGLVVTTWGAHPGHTIDDIQSGSGVVHNALLFDRPQKSIVRAPFVMRPKPVWFASHATALAMAPKVTRFEAAPSVAKLPGIFWNALRG
ncbi:MAG: aldehyde dehydrogenase family protein [Acidobacteriota bacterium]